MVWGTLDTGSCKLIALMGLLGDRTSPRARAAARAGNGRDATRQREGQIRSMVQEAQVREACRSFFHGLLEASTAFSLSSLFSL